jgi:predicted amidohydrolase YtcJ
MASTETPADLVLRGGAVYRLDAARSWATAVAIAGDRIIAVGGDSDLEPWIGPKSRVIDLRGAMVLPGFHDSHVHPVQGGFKSIDCNLDELRRPEAIVDAIRRHADAHPEAAWIRGGGWALPVFPNGNPTRALLDSAVADRPALLFANDGHSAWANSKALELCGVTAATPDPTGGRIERDAATGEPSGALREAAMDLVIAHLPARTTAELQEALRRGLQQAARQGITCLQEADASPELLETYSALDRRGELTADVLAALQVDPARGTEQVAELSARRAKYRGTRLRADAAKIFVDGVIDSRTAALLEPYEGSPTDRGEALWQPEALNQTVGALDREGFQIHVHAIGDRAIRMALDAFESAREINGARDARHHIAHVQLLDPADIPRFRRLGVVANFQPLWAYEDEYIRELTQPLVGPKRLRWLYPIASVVRSGAVVAFGSDWPVTSMNPLDGMQVAITRAEPRPVAAPAWIPEERIELPQALAGYTINGAFLAFREKEAGSIEVGKLADLVVLDRSLFDAPASEIVSASVRLTLSRGRIVYEREEAAVDDG